MKDFFEKIKELVRVGQIRISYHAYEEIENDNLFVGDIVGGIEEGIPIEFYPDFPKGSCLLVLQRDASGSPLHVLWGIPKGHQTPVGLITVYKPDPERWAEDFSERKPQ